MTGSALAVAPGERWYERAETRWLLASALLLWLAQRPWAQLPPALEHWFPVVAIAVAPAPVLAAFARRGGWAQGAVFAVLWWGLGGHWVTACHPTFGIFAWAGMVVFAAGFTWPLGWALGCLRDRWGADRMLWLAPLVWCGWETARTWGPMGCPWFMLGHSYWQAGPLPQVVELTGVGGLTLVTATCSAGFARLLLGLPGARRQLAVGCCGLLLLTLYGLARRPLYAGSSGPTHRVALVQPNVPQDEKANGDAHELFDRHLQLSLTAPRDTALLVWPETSVPVRMMLWPTMRSELTALAQMLRSTLVIGAVQPIPPQDASSRVVRNAAFVIDPQGREVDAYGKKHLVILGEYLPGREHWPVSVIAAQTPQYWAGPRYRATRSPLGPLGIPICYESAFPTDCTAMVRDGAEALVVLTNDDQLTEIGARQLYQQTVFRAIENRRWLARCSNSGISCVVAPTGAVVAASQWNRAMLQDGWIEMRRDVTLYTRCGNWLPLLCLLITACALGRRAGNRKS